MASLPGSEPEKIKPLVTLEMALPVLAAHFDRPILNLEAIQGGDVAQAFSFSVASERGEAQEYIIRFNPPMRINFEKEAYAYEHFASHGLPIPRVVHLGRLGGIFFAISEKLPGRNLLQIPRPEYQAAIPELIEVLDAIHQVPVTGRPGYGIFDGNGMARESSWQAHLAMVYEEEPEDDFMGAWHALFQNSFLERELFDSFYLKMLELGRYSPDERSLVHGDYGFGNVLVQDGRVTAVLDWMGARYGDFLYDVAWLDFWAAHDRWPERLAQYYEQAGRAVPFYKERILCCQCYIALNAMKFYAKAGSKESYDFTVDRMSKIIR